MKWCDDVIVNVISVVIKAGPSRSRKSKIMYSSAMKEIHIKEPSERNDILPARRRFMIFTRGAGPAQGHIFL